MHTYIPIYIYTVCTYIIMNVQNINAKLKIQPFLFKLPLSQIMHFVLNHTHFVSGGWISEAVAFPNFCDCNAKWKVPKKMTLSTRKKTANFNTSLLTLTTVRT